MANSRCTGCGRSDVETRAVICRWPDERVTVERHCPTCQTTWQPQLGALGAKIEASEETRDVSTGLRLDRDTK